MNDSKSLFLLLDEVYLEVEVHNFVQGIIDKASKYVVVGRMLEEKHLMIWWNPRVSHFLELILDNIGKIEWVKKSMEEEKFVTR
jgi:hypothetical protein